MLPASIAEVRGQGTRGQQMHGTAAATGAAMDDWKSQGTDPEDDVEDETSIREIGLESIDPQ